ncbi:MAG: ABC transporter permease [Candidatus Liptonbacteria bacterium]
MAVIINELNCIFALAYREVLHFSREKARIVVTFIFPVVLIGILGVAMQSNLSKAAGYSFITFAFTGVLGQILFQNTALGVLSLKRERGVDMTQENFVAPVSRVSIILGKIIGESVVALAQCAGVVIFGLIINIPISVGQLIALLPTALAICLLGGAFGLFVLSQIKGERGVEQVFPLLIVPQIFLGGVVSPIKHLPFYIWIISRLTPMTYAVDAVRTIFYRNLPEFDSVVLYSTRHDLLATFLFFLLFMIAGTYLFVKGERDR